MIIVKSTEVKNKFGKYINLLEDEDIIVTKNGSPVAYITKFDPEKNIKLREEAVNYKIEKKNNHDGRYVAYEEFLKITEGNEERYEYIDGRVYLLASPAVSHQIILGNLHIILHQWFKDKKCKPYLSPFDVTLRKSAENINVVQPDILVICDTENRNEKDRYTGTPALVIEIISKATRSKDAVKKLDLYMMTGVLEYWFINYFEKEVILYNFENKEISNMKVYSNNAEIESVSFKGLKVKLTDIFNIDF
jgi:prevent-host-death family protein